MIGWVKKIGLRRVWIIGAVTAGHAGLLAWALTLSMNPLHSPLPTAIDIDFADVQVPDPAIEPEPEPEPELELELEPEPEPQQDVTPDRVETPAPSRVAQNPSPQRSQAPVNLPSVLTQNAPAEPGGVPVAAVGPAPAETGETVDPETVASALRNLACQNLTMVRDESCPKLDPFDVAEASRARAEAPPSGPILIGDYGPKSMLENFMSQKDRAPFMFPGMSADLFTEGMAPGAYDAQRIRNGREPLWSQEMKDGFKRGD